MGIFSNVETINIPPLYSRGKRKNPRRILFDGQFRSSMRRGRSQDGQALIHFSFDSKIPTKLTTTLHATFCGKRNLEFGRILFGKSDNFFVSRATFNKTFPACSIVTEHRGRFLPPPGRCSRDRCGEKCARARHRARTLVTRTSGLVWERAASTNCGNG